MKAFFAWYLILNVSMLYGTWYFQYTNEALSAALLIMSSVCSIIYVSYFGDVSKSVGIEKKVVVATFLFNSILCTGLAVVRSCFVYVIIEGTQWIYFIFLLVSVLVELNTIGNKFDPI